MKAVVFDRYGPAAEVLSFRADAPKPTPGRSEVLVRMLASPINPSDLLYTEGKYGLKPRLPATPGFEGVGVVEESGGGLLGWLRKGKRVAVISDRVGNWAEYTVTKARQVIPVPDAIPDEQAAAFFVNPATAVAMTQDVLRVTPGAWLLQSAAGGELGKMVIRLGKKHTFRTINVVRRREQVEELKRLGADLVLVESDGPIDEQVRKATGDPGVRYAIDPVGGKTGTEVIASLEAGGRCLLYGVLSGEPVSVDPRFMITGSKKVEGFWLADHARRQSVLGMLRLFRRVRALMREGVLHTDIAKTYTLDQITEAVKHATATGKGGKVLLRIGERRP
ncbi:MAG TPA: zinc-dependent alcohol dehydrogenase family protein [Gemmataceae bacterium]|nr:zinc-dependent alcohol dehydrogenase family protein [Gemmataceae bacterium]